MRKFVLECRLFIPHEVLRLIKRKCIEFVHFFLCLSSYFRNSKNDSRVLFFDRNLAAAVVPKKAVAVPYIISFVSCIAAAVKIIYNRRVNLYPASVNEVVNLSVSIPYHSYYH